MVDFKARVVQTTAATFSSKTVRNFHENTRFDDPSVFEEWDFPNEFFFNTSTQQLYFNYNGTGVPSSAAVMTNLKVLFNMTSSRWDPIRNVTLRGLTFTASQITYMVSFIGLVQIFGNACIIWKIDDHSRYSSHQDPHGVISGGDWALDRFGTVFLQGTEHITVESCLFYELDGNGMISLEWDG